MYLKDKINLPNEKGECSLMWKEKYRIGVKRIDEQHEELFRRVESFLKALRQEGAWEEKLAKVKETLDFMGSYVVTHFADEEQYQKEIRFSGYEKHRQVHEKFKAEVENYVEKFSKEGFDENLVQEFGGKLMAWLINHVAGADQQIGQYAAKMAGEA